MSRKREILQKIDEVYKRYKAFKMNFKKNTIHPSWNYLVVLKYFDIERSSATTWYFQF